MTTNTFEREKPEPRIAANLGRGHQVESAAVSLHQYKPAGWDLIRGDNLFAMRANSAFGAGD
jgi:hypothetical protein